MPRHRPLTVPVLVLAPLVSLLLLFPVAAAAAADDDGFEDQFTVKPDDFASTGRNDYFILEPGYQLVLEGKDKGRPARLVITVLDQTKKVDGVQTRIVEEHESIDGKPVEISRNFFAIDKNNN